MKVFIIIFVLIHYLYCYDFRKGISRFKDKKVHQIEQFLTDTYDYREEFIKVKLDHFSYDNKATFDLRYLVNDKYFNKSSESPILFYCGNEGDIQTFYDNSGFITETLAKEFSSIVIFAEHRFFGKSSPFGVQDYEINKNKYLTVEQAMSDFIEVIINFKTQNNLTNNIIAFGGSYGGMLSSWSRMKFPHVYKGAIASSAPVLLFEDIKRISNSFFKIVTNTYKRYSDECPIHIRNGFQTISELKNNINTNILNLLNDIFKPCVEIKNKTDIDYLENTIEDAIVTLAQYNYPYETSFINPTPAEPVKVACQRINSKFNKTTEMLSPFMGYTYAKYNIIDPIINMNLNYLKEGINVFFNYTGTQKCLDIGNDPSVSPPPNGWYYLACTEMVMPMEKNGITDMFNPKKWDIEVFKKECQSWKSDIREKWAFDYFGGRDWINQINEYTNILYINGEMDPWNAGCPQVSNNPLIQIINADSAHHLDLRLPNENDPISIRKAREIMKILIKKWNSN